MCWGLLILEGDRIAQRIETTAPLPPIPDWRRHDGKERMVNSRARRRAATIAAEAATDRIIADKAPWWWDASAIAYRTQGEVTLRMAEGRLMRALVVSGAEGIRDAPRMQGDYTPASMAEAEREAAARASAPIPDKFDPGPIDLYDWDTAMRWFAALDPPELRTRSREPWSLTIEQKVLI